MNIFDYPGEMCRLSSGEEYPLYDIPQLSDQQWNELVVKNARENFRERNGREPANDLEAITYQREYLAGREVA